MWLITSKALGYLLSPLPFTIVLIMFAGLLAVIGAKILSRLFIIIGVAILVGCSLPVVERSLVQTLENQYPPIPVEQSPTAGIIVVLGGAIAMPSLPRIEVELHDSSDRILHAFRLYKAGKSGQILLSAGNVYKNIAEHSEAFYMSQLLNEWGIPKSDIIVGGSSRSTRENAIETLELLENNKNPEAPVLLVTSASHMPRAVRTFQKVGINVIPSSTDFSAGPSSMPAVFNWLPSVDALKGFSKAWHEILGGWVYQLRGWT